jgi:hypothetical protein
VREPNKSRTLRFRVTVTGNEGRDLARMQATQRLRTDVGNNIVEQGITFQKWLVSRDGIPL